MGIEVRRNFTGDDLKRKVNPTRFQAKLQREMLKRIGEIKTRTQSGRGVEGAPLPPLSEAYKKRKAKAGRNPIADRTLSGNLLKAIQSRTQVGGYTLEGTVYFTNGAYRKSRATVAQVAKAMQSLAPFFGLSRKQKDKTLSAIKRAYKEDI